jgi:hypothetical protein
MVHFRLFLCHCKIRNPFFATLVFYLTNLGTLTDVKVQKHPRQNPITFLPAHAETSAQPCKLITYIFLFGTKEGLITDLLVKEDNEVAVYSFKIRNI